MKRKVTVNHYGQHMTSGMSDLHIHTSASDGVATVREVLDYVQEHTRLDVIAITDHDRVDASNWAYEHSDTYDFEVVPGIEVTTQAGHVLGLWVKAHIPRDMTFYETVSAIHEQGGVAVLAHPFHFYIDRIRDYCWQYNREPHMLAEAGFDAIEIHNSGILVPGLNLLAKQLACRSGLAITGNSDAHTLGAVGTGMTRFPGRTAADLHTALIEKKTYAEGRPWPISDYWNYLRNSTHNRSSEFLVERSI